MGGMGSGNWYRWQSKKTTVEESLTLGMKDLRRRLHVGTSGSLTWTRGNGHKSSIGYYAKVIDAWGGLPEATWAGIVAMVQAAGNAAPGVAHRDG